MLLYGRRGLALFGMGCWLAQSALAGPPVNDQCAGAVIIPTAGPFPYYTAVLDMKDASVTNDPPAPSCRAVSVTRSVWYKFTPPTTDLYTISASGDTATTVLDTVMAIYTSPAGCGGPFSQFACNDDQGNCQSAISMTLSANVTYYIVVWMSSVSPPLRGMTSLQLRVSRPVAPANDACAGAETIPSGGPFPHLTSIADTTLATTTGDPALPSCGAAYARSVWFQFTPEVAATYEFSLCTNTATTIYETVMAIYASPAGCGGTFTQISCNHTNPCSNKPRSTITTPLQAGLTYYLVAWEGDTQSYVPGETSLQVRVARFLPPLATTLAASAITSTSAVLQATISANGLPTTVWFEWGTSSTYGNVTAARMVGDGNHRSNVADLIGGLQPGQDYHYRIVAMNALGTTRGADHTVRWSTNSPWFMPVVSASGAFLLRFTGQPGQVYLVEGSGDLTDWVGLGPATDMGNGMFEFPIANGLVPRFFRARSP